MPATFKPLDRPGSRAYRLRGAATQGEPVRYHHLYADETGESRWKDVDVPLEERVFAPPAQGIEVSDAMAAGNLLFLRLRAGWSEPDHPTPVPQMLICVAGAAIVTASDGEARRIGQGDMWFMEDTTGKGHHTRVDGAADFEAVIVQTG